jgi:hypothetical protein
MIIFRIELITLAASYEISTTNFKLAINHIWQLSHKNSNNLQKMQNIFDKILINNM